MYYIITQPKYTCSTNRYTVLNMFKMYINARELIAAYLIIQISVEKSLVKVSSLSELLHCVHQIKLIIFGNLHEIRIQGPFHVSLILNQDVFF